MCADTYVYVPMRTHLWMVAGIQLCCGFSSLNPRFAATSDVGVLNLEDLLKLGKSATHSTDVSIFSPEF